MRRLIKRLRCVIYLDDRIPEEADILDFFNLGGARRLRSEAFRRLLLSGWMAANQTQAMSASALNERPRSNRRSMPADKGVKRNEVSAAVDLPDHADGVKPTSDKISVVSTFNTDSDGLLYDDETSAEKRHQPAVHKAPSKTDTEPRSGDGHKDFFGKLF